MGCPPYLLREAAAAIGRKDLRHLLQRLLERALVGHAWLIIMGTARQVQDVADHRGRIGGAEHLAHLPFLVPGEAKSCEAVFAISNSMVRRPTSRSNSAMRAWAS